MTNYRKRTTRNFISILIAATLVLTLGIVAYASDLFGNRTLLVKNDDLPPTKNEEGIDLSITQPQQVSEKMDNSINEKIEKSTKAWAEWNNWQKEYGIHRPDVFVPPEGCGYADHIENGDGTYTIVFYKPILSYDENGKVVTAEFEEMEKRIATAEEYEQNLAYAEAVAKGLKGYDFDYRVYTQEMADKLESIAASYGLKLRREMTIMYEDVGDIVNSFSFNEISTRINEVCSGGYNFFRTAPTGFDSFYYFDEGTFSISFFTADDKTNLATICNLYNSPYGTMSSGFEIISEIENSNAMETYVHRTPDGTEITVFHNGGDMFAHTYLENSFVTMVCHQSEGFSTEEINSIIDMVDFSTIKTEENPSIE